MDHDENETKYLSAKNWARRWDCSLSSIRRAARRFNVRRIHIGGDRLVRYALEDIERIEAEYGVGPAHSDPDRPITNS